MTEQQLEAANWWSKNLGGEKRQRSTVHPKPTETMWPHRIEGDGDSGMSHISEALGWTHEVTASDDDDAPTTPQPASQQDLVKAVHAFCLSDDGTVSATLLAAFMYEVAKYEPNFG